MTTTTQKSASRTAPRLSIWLISGVAVVIGLAIWSVFTGTTDLTISDVVAGEMTADQRQVIAQSRIPRTLAVILSGSSLAVAGMLMQMIVQNRYVEPATTGVTESAIFGLLVVTLLAPAAPLVTKMIVAVVFAFGGSMLLMVLIRSVPRRDLLVVPLLGIILSGVIGSASTFLAWQYGLQGTVAAWHLGDFSGVISGRYELLWAVGVAALVVFIFSDRFTVLGLGENLATSLGLNHKQVTMLGLTLVSIVAGICTIVAGALPFLGLVVPNLVSMVVGDYMRRSLPLVALGGAIFVLAADIVSRSLIAPAEVPVGTVMGVVGAIIFLSFLFRTLAHD